MATKRELRGLEPFRSKVSVNVTGLNELAAMLGRLGKEGQVAVRDVLVAKAELIVRKAKPLTPDDPETAGALRDSVRMSQTRMRSNGSVTVSVIAGGKPLERRLQGRKYSAWALVQHEDLTLQHPFGGQAKYIEQPFMEVAPSIPGAVLDALDKVAKRS